MNICWCGAMAGYLHSADCPYPLFRGSDAEIDKWLDARAQRSDPHAVRMLDGGDATCGRTDDSYDNPRDYA